MSGGVFGMGLSFKPLVSLFHWFPTSLILNHPFLVNEYGDLSFFHVFCNDQILSIKQIQINFYVQKIDYHRKHVLVLGECDNR